MIRRAVTIATLIAILFQSHHTADACGPSFLAPIFVFEESPDPPFEEFAAGKIGIVKPTFGRKTLVIAYRYLNGASFTAGEQTQLVLALKARSPDDDDPEALKAWIALRKEVTPDEELPEIYRDRQRPWGYDYFPNCAKNAFEVAATTLKARIASYGSGDGNVREWIRGQDEVFQNCSGRSPSIPKELNQAAPLWLRKDRDYQIAAAFFYSMQFDDAAARFAKIAADGQSDWQATAEYLVARTRVRQASLTEDQEKKSSLYAAAEGQLLKLSGSNNQFRDASQKLLGLVKFRIHPRERLTELAEILSRPGASLDVRQDLIDYVWLVDKFEAEALKKEHDRREALKPVEKVEQLSPYLYSRAADEDKDRENMITVSYVPLFADGSPDYGHSISLRLRYDTPPAEIFRQIEERAQRTLTDGEQKVLQAQIDLALAYRRMAISNNIKLARIPSAYEGCQYCYDFKLSFADVPPILRTNDVTDWIFAMQIGGPQSYEHAVAQWRETDSPAWLVAALANAEPNSPNIRNLMRAAERVSPDAAAFPTVAFHLVRLRLAAGLRKEAHDLLEQVATRLDLLPISAQNEFQAQRLVLAQDLAQFLKYAARKPAAFYDSATLYKSVRDLVDERKSSWSDYEGQDESKEEFEARVDHEYRDLLADDLRLFDARAADVINRHFPLAVLLEAAREEQTSSYLRRSLLLLVLTRALLLNQHEVARQIADDVYKVAPELAPLLAEYIEAKTDSDRERAALFLLLKSPGLTPFFTDNIEQQLLTHAPDYYLQSAWWCAPDDTDYSAAGEAVKKQVSAPGFLNPQQLAAAKHDFERLAATGDAKSYLGKKILNWARSSPDDPRIPEALFIAFEANASYKYGCNGWSHDEETQNQAAALLRERYPRSAWTARLPKEN